ncbi:hypothetical protein AMJ80_09340 [bacterium SM23_31]|nr:MAG: hypothetical protein AMJ80_09340 [bacterium SM23_31]
MDKSWKYILEKFRIEPPSPETLQYYFLLSFLLLIGIILVWIILSIRRKRKLIEREWRWFHKLAEAKDLSEEEAEALAFLAQTHYPKAPHRLLQSVLTYDGTVKKFLHSDKNRELFGSEYETAELFKTIREKCFLKDYHVHENLLSTREIHQGQKIRLTTPAETRTRFLYTIVSANTSDAITLECDAFKELIHLFIPKAVFTGYYWRANDAGYQFPVVVRELVNDSHVVCDHSEKIIRKQRRHFFRVDVRLTGKFSRITEKEAQFFKETNKFPESTSQEKFLGKIVSLSGGGISFFTNVNLKLNDLLRIEILVDKNVSFTGIIGRITRIREFEKRFKVFVEFTVVIDRSRKAIVHYVSLQQRVKKPYKTDLSGN